MPVKQAARNFHGFTLIEMLIFVSVTTMVFIVMLGVINYASINMKQSQYKVIATHFSEELIEWFRYQRDKDGFITMYNRGSGAGTTYCFNDIIISTWPSSGDCSPEYTLKNFYNRTITLKQVSGTFDEVYATVITGWRFFDLQRNSAIELRITNN